MSSPLARPKEKTFQTKQALVYHALREAIMQTHLEPGTRLVIDDLARQFQVSPIPVREALHMLQSEHLVEQKAHVGAIVAPLSPEDAREIFALLEALETAVFTAAAARVTPADADALNAVIARMRNVRSDERWMALNHHFHRTIATIAHMPRALAMIDRVSGEWERLRRYRFRTAGHPKTAAANREHQAMVNALAAQDVAALERLVRTHNRSALAFYLGA